MNPALNWITFARSNNNNNKKTYTTEIKSETAKKKIDFTFASDKFSIIEAVFRT